MHHYPVSITALAILMWNLAGAAQLGPSASNPLPGGITPQPDEVRAPTAETLTAPTSADFEQQVVERVNQERDAQGLAPLKRNVLLDSSSNTHSDNMANRDFFAHCDLDLVTSPFDRITAAGYAWINAGENIAAGYTTSTAVMDGWMGSPGHRNNILSPKYREIGVGYTNATIDFSNVRIDENSDCVADGFGGPFYRYWTQNFGRRNDVYPVVINGEAAETDTRDVNLYVYGAGWATDMRLKNESGTWSSWEPYLSNKLWELSSGNGVKQVDVELRNISNMVLTASDTIALTMPCAVPDDELDLPLQTIDYQQTFQACSLIAAAYGFEINAPGDVTFQAPRIALGPGFKVQQGARFTVMSETP